MLCPGLGLFPASYLYSHSSFPAKSLFSPAVSSTPSQGWLQTCALKLRPKLYPPTAGSYSHICATRSFLPLNAAEDRIQRDFANADTKSLKQRQVQRMHSFRRLWEKGRWLWLHILPVVSADSNHSKCSQILA